MKKLLILFAILSFTFANAQRNDTLWGPRFWITGKDTITHILGAVGLNTTDSIFKIQHNIFYFQKPAIQATYTYATLPSATTYNGSIVNTTDSGLFGASLGSWIKIGGSSSSGAVSAVSNSDGSLTISPTTGSVVASLNVANSNTWTAAQLINLTALGSTITSGLTLENTTAAISGTQQISPAISWIGKGYKSNATAGSQTVEFSSYVLPIQGTTNATGSWNLNYQINGGTVYTPLTITANDANSGNSFSFLDNYTGSFGYSNGSNALSFYLNRTASSGNSAYYIQSSGTSQAEFLWNNSNTTIDIGSLSSNVGLRFLYSSGSVAATISGTTAQATFNGILSTSGNLTAATGGNTTATVFQIAAATYTNSTTAGSGTATWAVANLFGQPTFATTNASITTTNAATIYINGPANGSNNTITNAYGLYVASGLTGFGGNAIPITTATYNLGTSSLVWSNLYVNQINATTNLALVPASAGFVLQQNGSAAFGSIVSTSGAKSWTFGYLTNGTTQTNGSVFVVDSLNDLLLQPGGGVVAYTQFRGNVAFGASTSITSGSSSTLAGGYINVFFNPASVIASYTLTLPASPPDGDMIRIFGGGTISGGSAVVTSFTVSANSGQSLMQTAAPTTLLGGNCYIYQYWASNTTWYRVQ